MSIEEHMAEIREASGDVHSEKQHRLVGFLYELMRDKIPCGEVENIMINVMSSPPDEEIRFTNGWLARYAANIAGRLLEEQ
mgnify:CR=1 FL=1